MIGFKICLKGEINQLSCYNFAFIFDTKKARNTNKTKQIFVGNVAMGGDSPISVQSMTFSKSKDIIV